MAFVQVIAARSSSVVTAVVLMLTRGSIQRPEEDTQKHFPNKGFSLQGPDHAGC